MLYDYETVTNYLHFTENSIWFGSIVTKKWRFLKGDVANPFHPSFDRRETQATQWTREFPLLKIQNAHRLMYKWKLSNAFLSQFHSKWTYLEIALQIQIFIRLCGKSLPSNFWQKGDSHYTMNTEFRTPFKWCMEMYLQNLNGRDLWHTSQKSKSLRDYWTKSDGDFAGMQIISYSFIILNHIQSNSQFGKLFGAESPIVFFFFTNGSSEKCTWKLSHLTFN